MSRDPLPKPNPSQEPISSEDSSGEWPISSPPDDEQYDELLKQLADGTPANGSGD